ncbi:MAG: sulfotransferase family 2 domain-containing protein [Sphingomicrobium sp.]
MIDFGKRLHQRATDLLCGRPVVFHHVPKCGGTSLGRALRRAYILSQGTVTPHESLKAFNAAQNAGRRLAIGHVSELREMMLLYMLYSHTRCVSAHIPFSDAAYEEFADRYLFVTILRDPVDRFISNYYWSHKHPKGLNYIPEPFEEFVLSERARLSGSTYVRYFCGEPGQEFSAKHVDAAIRNLHRMNCVGFLDEVGRFEAALQTLTGRPLKIGRENVGNTGAKRDAILSGALRDRVLEACSLDREIWNAIQDLRNRTPG